jgi:hypothetical protein
MEDIFTYIIVFGLLIGFSALYLFRKDNKRTFPLSVKQWGKFILTVSVKKQNRKVKDIVIGLNFPADEKNFFVEFIGKGRKTESFRIVDFVQQVDKPSESKISFPYDDFKNKIKENRFRFGYHLDNNNSKIKSHELTISKHWNMYKVDSGRYN